MLIERPGSKPSALVMHNPTGNGSTVTPHSTGRRHAASTPRNGHVVLRFGRVPRQDRGMPRGVAGWQVTGSHGILGSTTLGGMRGPALIAAGEAVLICQRPRSTDVATGTEVSASVDDVVTCMFWNVNRRDRRDLIGRLAAQEHADVVVLAEHPAQSKPTLEALRREVGESFFEPPSDTPRLRLFARRPTLDLQEIYADASGRVTIRLLRYERKEFLFVAAHLPSKVNWNREDQTAEVQVLADQIRDEESRRRHRRTILCGDLNMNPFEDGVVQASGLHAMMTKTTVEAGTRTVQGREYPFFYNPMWGFFGDRTQGPPGTYYYRHSGHLSYEWNIFDQVLIRPEALPWFADDVEIVARIGDTELGRPDGRPNREIGSDHFPIVFRLSPTR